MKKGPWFVNDLVETLRPKRIRIEYVICHTCHQYHPIRRGNTTDFDNYARRHNNHHLVIRPSWWFQTAEWWKNRHREPMAYTPNADIKIAYAATTIMASTLASLAESATHVTGREATAVDNGTNLYADYLFSGKIQTGTTPTLNETIQVRVFGEIDDAPEYPDVMDGTDSAETWTSTQVRDAGSKIAAIMPVTASSDISYEFGPTSVAAKFGGIVPPSFGAFISQSTDVNLNSTEGNHEVWATGVYFTST